MDQSQLAIIQEAAKRGLLPSDQMAVIQEAQKRGMFPGADSSGNPDIQQQMTTTPANAGQVQQTPATQPAPQSVDGSAMGVQASAPPKDAAGLAAYNAQQAKSWAVWLSSPKGQATVNAQDTFWGDAKNQSTDPQGFQSYVQNYPDMHFGRPYQQLQTTPQQQAQQQQQQPNQQPAQQAQPPAIPGQPDKSDLGATVNGLFQGFANFLGNQGDAARIEMGQSGDNPDELTQGANQAFKQGGLITNTVPSSELGAFGNTVGNMVGGSIVPDLVTGGMAGAPGLLKSMLLNNTLQGGVAYGTNKVFPNSPLAQLAAGIAVPGLRMAPALGKRMLTGNPDTYAANLKAFQDAGINPHLGQVGSGVSKALTSILSKFPGSYGQFYKLAQSQNEAAQGRVLGAADNLGDAVTPNGAGNALQQDINGTKNKDGTFVTAMKNKWDQLNSKFFSHMKPKDNMSLGNTMSILDELSKPIDGLDETSQMLRNGLIRDLKDKLRTDTSPTIVSSVPANSTARGVFDKNGQPLNLTPEGNTPAIPGHVNEYTVYDPVYGNEQTIRQPAAGPAGNGYPERRYPKRLVTDGKDFVQGANFPTTSVEAADALRRMIGKKLGETSLLNPEEQGIYSRVYKGLSDDFRLKAGNTSPEALKAWNNQNNFWDAARNRLNVLEPLGDNASPGRAWQSIFSDGKLDAKKMWQVRRSVTPETWKDQVATWLTQSGQPAGKQGAEWNLNTFLQNYEKLAPETKTALFGGQGMNGLDKELDKLYQAGKRIRDTAKYGANPTGSGQSAVQGGIVASALTSALTGHFKTAGAMMAIGPAGMGVGKLLTSPWFVNRLAQASKLPASQIPGYMARVSAAMQQQPSIAGQNNNQVPAQLDWGGFDQQMKDNQQNDPANVQGSNDLKPSVVELNPVVKSAAAAHSIDPKWVSALVNNEAVKKNGHYLTSSKGAVGPMQILPSTASDYGVTPDKLADPETNIKVGTTHYAHLLKVFGDPVVAAMAYNAGEGEIKYLMHKYHDNWQAHLPNQTKVYAQNFEKQIS